MKKYTRWDHHRLKITEGLVNWNIWQKKLSKQREKAYIYLFLMKWIELGTEQLREA